MITTATAASTRRKVKYEDETDSDGSFKLEESDVFEEESDSFEENDDP